MGSNFSIFKRQVRIMKYKGMTIMSKIIFTQDFAKWFENWTESFNFTLKRRLRLFQMQQFTN
jgi:hypothetical protein